MPVKLNSSGGGSVTLDVPVTASNFTLNLPAANGTLVGTAGGATVEFGAGSASAPSITTTGDTNTGMFFPAADTIAFTEGGVERLRVGPEGQIGIGGANYGTSGQVLTSNGSGAAPSWQSASASGALLNVQVFTSSGTYTRTAGATRAVVIAVGGGGGGGNSGAGGAGGTTSFGSHVSAGGGGGGLGFSGGGGAGGTGGTGALISIRGQPAPTDVGVGGGPGGGRPSGGVGQAGVRGGGGSGGSPGGQGETSLDYITSGLGATETVTIGAGGVAGAGGGIAAAGGAGYVIVYEYS